MPIYPFRYCDEKDLKAPQVYLTEAQEKRRRRDTDEMAIHKRYRDKYKPDFVEGTKLFNLMQQGTNDVVSNFYLGWARTYIDQSISMMTQAMPDFSFDPGPQNYKLAIIYKGLVTDVMRKGDWTTHSRHWMTDMHVMGPGVLHVFNRTPQRLDRWENEDGTIEEKIITDMRRQKVGIEHVNVLSCWRSSYDLNINDVTGGGYEISYPRALFVQEFANATTPNGKPKYDQKAIKQLLKQSGTHFMVRFIYHDVRNEHSIYAIPYGAEEEGQSIDYPEYELGLEIFYKPLKRRRIQSADGSEFVSGHNVLGSVPLFFSGFADRYDSNARNLSLYPMGIPKLIEAPEMVMDAMNNMMIDNMRMSNTVFVGYKPYQGSNTYPDLDIGAGYSGQWIDGEVQPQSLGVSRMGDNTAMMDFLRRVFNDLTGINPSLNSDDPSRTAFELAQKQRSNNARAQYRLKGMEAMMARAGHMLLANCISDLTVPEWEHVTKEEADNIVKLIEQGAMTADDFDPEKKRKRTQYFFSVPGRKFREDFSESKTRSLNTLTEDTSSDGSSVLPVTTEYLLPTGNIQDVLNYSAQVDMAAALGDQKIQDRQSARELLTLAINTQQDKNTIDRLFKKLVEIEQIDTKEIFGDDTNESDKLKQARQLLDYLKSSPSQNAQDPTQMAGQMPGMAGPMPQQPAPVNPGAATAQPSASQAPSASLARFATGGI